MARVLMFSTLGLLAWLCLFSSEPVQAGKVLVMPVDGSYWLSMKILVEELSQRGHEMVVLVPETSVLIRASGNYITKYFRVPYTLAELNANMDHIKKKPVQAGKVLVMPVDGSHWLSMKILVEELSQRGHEMVVLVPETSVLIRASGNYITKSFRVPYTDAEMNAILDHIKKNAIEKPPQLTDFFENLGNLIEFTNMQVKACEGLLYDEPLMKSLRETGFDILLTDPFLPCGTILADSLSLPPVYFLHGIPCRLDESAAQCPSPPSFIPRFITGYSDKMTFPQRVTNMFMTVFEMFLCRKLYTSFDELASRYLQKDTTYEELLGHGAVWLHRYDFTFEFPKPQMPNMVHIGGINCAKRGPLTKVRCS
ncbi:UDP-glucuronosyltransferase 1-1 [Anabarilius grahami]|uniref:UDP-glucuronosyltransferase 1-1 n=1 Tax=Anabarilius grahami TaxID=495550 RepID=A0A3N0Z1B4_ANAGA|nr:UDP-glucuronosyltransferase 1-1 [Anabarilius grahami]